MLFELNVCSTLTEHTTRIPIVYYAQSSFAKGHYAKCYGIQLNIKQNELQK
jgi:hypothetical protein